MSDGVSEQLANLNIKELDESKIEELFNAVKGLKQVKDVVVLSNAGKPLHATTDLSDAELAYAHFPSPTLRSFTQRELTFSFSCSPFLQRSRHFV